VTSSRTVTPMTKAPNASSTIKTLISVGSFVSDLNHGYTLQWGNWEAFGTWLRHEQSSKGIELVRKNIRKASAHDPWLQRHEFVCSRQGAGSQPKFIPKNPGQKRSIAPKRIGCQCRLTVKTYPNTEEVLGKYNATHDHEIGKGNIRFTRLSKELKEQITQMLGVGVESQRIVNSFCMKTAVAIY
jgi:hypothetical protein